MRNIKNTHKLRLSGIILAGALLTITQFAMAVPVIDTTSSSFGNLSPFGETNTATYGQTFTVTGTETLLNDFSFRFNDYVNPDFVDFAAYVYAWDGSKATGSQLFASSALSTTNNGGADGFEQFTINTGSLQLISGIQYVAFFSASNFFDGVLGTSFWELSTSDAYSGGNVVWDNNGNSFASLTTNTWDCSGSCVGGRDLWFNANFSSVPAPSTLAVLSLGIFGIGVARRKKA